ncbi:MAG: class I SAM-dependent methyltransferase [Thermoanaerobaculia bacterium]
MARFARVFSPVSQRFDEQDYVLGTHDEEMVRLGLQHRVWRPRATDAWRRAGFTVGQTLLDLGCGPGYASIDLAEIVGPRGQIVAVERSARYLDALRASARRNGLTNIMTHQLDLDTEALPDVVADGAWVRWVFAFLKRPRDLVARVADALRPGAMLVIHEYFDYGTWRFAQHSPGFEEFVLSVMKSWRATGGEPDIARDLPAWLEDLDLRITSLNPIIDVITPDNFVWQWPKSFVDVGLRRLVDIGEMAAQRADEIRNEFVACESAPHARMITPGVLEIIARKG